MGKKRDKIANVKPKSINQKKMIDAFEEYKATLAIGSAGTGKTFIAIYLALSNLHNYRKITICRSIVPTRDIGFLKGTTKEKIDPYILPYRNIVAEIMNDSGAYNWLEQNKQLEFVTTSHIRGLTLDNTIIVIDEVQNMDKYEIESVLTRVGENTKVILCGDNRQNDLFRSREKSGIEWLSHIAKKMPKHFNIVNFQPKDIVRSGFVRDLLLTIEHSGS